MVRFRSLLTFTLLVLFALPAFAEPGKAAWTAQLIPPDARAGESAQVVLTARIEAGWHIYSLKTYKEGPLPTTVALVPGKALTANGPPVQPPPLKEIDKGFNIEVEKYEGGVAFGLPVQIAAGVSGGQKAAVKARFQACDAKGCLPPETVEVPVEFTVAPGPARPDHAAAVTTVPPQPEGAKTPAAESGGSAAAPAAASSTPPSDAFSKRVQDAKQSGLLAFMALALSMGFLALLTPCVFPMIPVTVSFFSKQKTDGERMSLRGPIAYCLGIMGTFTLLGVLVTVLFGATGIQQFAVNPYINLGMALLFIVLAANLFGVFEIVVPSALLSKTSARSRQGGLLGPILMGLTFSLTSFTCTVPFVGTLLVSAAQGSLLYPVMGMLAFSAAFALPFFLLALFPQYLARLPKSGSWLVSVKAAMGFLELAAALKFLSGADVAWQKGLLTRPVFLAVWAAISAVAALYLLGWVRLPHDAPNLKVGWPRRLLGLATVVAALYCLAGINGAPLGNIESFLPPDPYPGRSASANAVIKWVDGYEEGRKIAQAQKRLMFINFTGAN